MRHNLILSIAMLLIGWILGHADREWVVADAATPPCICLTVTPTITAAPSRTPTPTMVTAMPSGTPIGGAATCPGFASAEGVKWQYRYTDPNRTGINVQRVRAGPGTGWSTKELLPRGEWREAYWKLGDWIALDRNCTRWLNHTLGEHRVDF